MLVSTSCDVDSSNDLEITVTHRLQAQTAHLQSAEGDCADFFEFDIVLTGLTIIFLILELNRASERPSFPITQFFPNKR